VLLSTVGAALSAAMGAAPEARAGEREWVVSPTVGYHVVQAEGTARHGGGVGLDVEYGLTDSWALRGSGHYAGHAFSLDGGYLQMGGLGFGALYTFDVLRVVPYASATVGASVIGGAGVSLRYTAEIRLGVGADYLVQRDFSVGLELRYTLLVPDIQRFPYAIGVAIRLSWRQQ
jgi:hypothetical protein